MKSRSLIIIQFAILALIPIIPFFIVGYHGQDFPFHICSWVDLRAAWLSGKLDPGWSEGANFTLGDPRFLYYPPVSLIIATALTIISPLSLAPAILIWGSVFLAGLTMYFAGGAFVSVRDRKKAALLYMLNPYLLVTVLSRFAVGELLVQSWLPVLVLFYCRATLSGEKKSTVLLGSLLGLSWVTNIPESIVLFYSFLIATIAMVFIQRRIKPLIIFLLQR